MTLWRKWWMVAMMLGTLAGGTQTLHGAPVAQWLFDEGEGTTTSEAQRATLCRVHNAQGRPEWRRGVRGQALLFDGYSTFVTCPGGTLPVLRDGFTFEGWIAVRAFSDIEQPLVSQHERPEAGFVFGLQRLGSWGVGFATRERWVECIVKEPLPKERWVHVAATYDKQAGLCLYLDGELAESLAVQGELACAPHAELLLGRSSTCPGTFNGLLDELRIHDRALSAEQLRQSREASLAAETPDLAWRRERLAGDPHRPRYHFLPPANWMNDPNGLIQWKGEYHLFYQHNPHGPFWGTMHWGHAVSKDLVHWQDKPIALAPSYGGDAEGCWSGVAVDDQGTPTLVYTGVFPEVQCLATGDERMESFEKCAANPVVGAPPEGIDVTGFRDPNLWREGKTWYMTIGSGIRNVGGTVLLYRSQDLRRWEFLKPIVVGDRQKTGQTWECPALFALGERHALVYSDQPEALYVRYFTGRYENHEFVPERSELADLGRYYYAAATLLDDKGQRLLWAWVKEARSDERQRAAGWSGVMSLPRVLAPRADGKMGMAPARELEALRGERKAFTSLVAGGKGPLTLEGVSGRALELRARFGATSATQVGLRLCCSPDGKEQTLVYYDREKGRLECDRRSASLDAATHRDVQGGAFELGEGEELELRVFVDASVIEVFANGHACLTTRVYPTRDDADGVGLYARGGEAQVRSLEAWEMKPIW